ncbi:MAG: AAA family ATPase, partial [Candidatus Portiera sp.]|nr:AAA family ATPase [Portiera sp.]
MFEDTFAINDFKPGPIEKITIKGLMSIKELKEFKLGKINILIGANGAGKSNFLEAFNLLEGGVKNNLGFYVDNTYSDPTLLFYKGPDVTDTIELAVNYDEWNYQTQLGIFKNNQIRVKENNLEVNSLPKDSYVEELFDSEKSVYDKKVKGTRDALYRGRTLPRREIVRNSWCLYEIDERSRHPRIFRRSDFRNNLQLSYDFRNLAPILLDMQKQRPKDYKFLLDTIRLTLPHFEDFVLKVERHSRGDIMVDLRWQMVGSDLVMGANHLSPGSLRFIALMACMLQSNPPSVIIIDEPELGLHPEAIELFADFVKSDWQKSQVIFATQSSDLVDAFAPEDIITVNHGEAGSEF